MTLKQRTPPFKKTTFRTPRSALASAAPTLARGTRAARCRRRWAAGGRWWASPPSAWSAPGRTSPGSTPGWTTTSRGSGTGRSRGGIVRPTFYFFFKYVFEIQSMCSWEMGVLFSYRCHKKKIFFPLSRDDSKSDRWCTYRDTNVGSSRTPTFQLQSIPTTVSTQYLNMLSSSTVSRWT